MAGIFLVKLLVLEVFVCIHFVDYSSSLPCSPNAWIQLQGANVSQMMSSAVNASNVTDCQSKCLADNNCTGVAWSATVSMCYFNLDSSNLGIDYLNGNNSIYYGLIRNYSSCDKNNYNCSLTWIGVKDYHGFGAMQIDRSSVIDCVRWCQDNLSCAVVEWNYQESSCWIYTGLSDYTSYQSGIFQFIRNCTNGLPSTTGTTRPSTPGPNTTTSTVTPTTQSSSTTTTTTTTVAPTPTSPQTPYAAAEMSEGGNDWYPLAIKPAYIVLAGVGGGCILMVITAVVILCEYSLNKSFYSTSGSHPSPSYQTHHREEEEEAQDYVDAGGDAEDMGMSEMEIDKRPYGNAEEFQRD